MGLITTGDSVDDGVTVAQKTDNEAKESKTPSTRNSNRNPNYKNRPTQSKCDPTRDPFCIPFASWHQRTTVNTEIRTQTTDLCIDKY